MDIVIEASITARDLAKVCLGAQCSGGSPGSYAPECLDHRILNYKYEQPNEDEGRGEWHDFYIGEENDPLYSVKVESKTFRMYDWQRDKVRHWIDEVFVGRSIRNEGVGRFFVDVVKIIAQTKGLGPVYASLQPTDESFAPLGSVERFYERCGFVRDTSKLWGWDIVYRADV